MEKTTAIILGGGTGSRLGGKIPKQFLLLNEKMIIEHTLDKFENCNLIDEIIIVSIESHIEEFEKIVKKNKYDKVKKIVVGGDTRQQSVSNGLKLVASEFVMVHDGVRPFVSEKNIIAIIQSMRKNGSGVLAVRVNDSLKLCEGQKIKATIERKNIWAMQTPQGFISEKLKKAHHFALEKNHIGTDESELLELIGEEVSIVEGCYDNIKITTTFDLELGKLIINKNLKVAEN